jgi:hypothetical protein
MGTAPANGTVALNPDGSFTYTPRPAFSGTDTFTCTAADATTTSALATVTIAVGAEERPGRVPRGSATATPTST